MACGSVAAIDVRLRLVWRREHVLLELSDGLHMLRLHGGWTVSVRRLLASRDKLPLRMPLRRYRADVGTLSRTPRCLRLGVVLEVGGHL